MSTGFQELRSEQLTDALAAILIPKLVSILQVRSPGHCMRVAHLEQPVMQRLVADLRTELKRSQISAEVYILSQDVTQQSSDLFITSTKLVELRNPLPDQSLRSPLLVFLPRDLQTNAEDSFNVASFEDIPVGTIYGDLTQKLLKEISLNFQGYVRGIFDKLSEEKWQWASPINQIRYLLVARSNGTDGDTLGAALYELGLVPDFHLFDDPSTVQTRLLKNLEAMRKLSGDSNLTIRGRVLSLHLLDGNLRSRIIQLVLSHEADSPHNWTKQIVLDKHNWDLDFTGWTRQEDIEAGKIQIEIKSLDLPYASETSSDQRLLTLVGSQYLAAKDQKKIKGEVSIASTPVIGLSYFTVQMISRASGPIGSPKKVKAGKAFKSFTLDKLDKIEFDEGWHYVRVLAWTETGIPIPVEQLKTDSSNNIIPNESEDFYVLPDGELEEEAIFVTTKVIESLAHLNFKLQLDAIANNQPLDKISIGNPTWNEATGNKKSSGEELEIRCGKFGKFGVSVSSHLKWIEREILQSPEKSGSWKQSSTSAEPLFLLQEWQIHHQTEVFKAFIKARSQYFQYFTSGEFAHIAQSIDWLDIEQSCLEYAATYNAWLDELKQCLEQNPETSRKHQLLQDLRQALAIDAVYLKWRDSLSLYQEAVLVGPTHPLRALWFLAWTKISQDWINRSLDDPEFSISILDSIQLVNPTSIPAFHPLEDGRIFTTIDNLTTFWSVYAPPSTADIQGLIIQVCQTLEMPQASRTGSSNIKAGILADKVSRYLVQHPYIQTLVINIFNLSRADLLAEVLNLVRKQIATKSLYFDIRVFTNSPDLIGIEEYVETLSHIASEDFNTDKTGTSIINSSLFPKFSLSIHPNSEFKSSPEDYPAHISILFDVFSVATVEVLPEFTFAENSSLYGLTQDFAVQFEQDNAGTRWYRQPLCKVGSKIPVLEDVLSCFYRARLATVEAIATVATGIPSFNKRPTVTLSLSPKEQKFIHQIHSASDWVLTVDRNLGIEFFDQDISTDTPAYLVDYVPGPNAGSGHQLLVTSRSLTELESILLHLLASRGLKVDQNQCAIILNQLRSLSGRLALKLISSSSHQAEVLGLALARLFLASQHALKNQAILPIDTHVDLFKTAQRQADRIGAQLQLQRTDLALFHLNLAERTIQFNLVEVKCYSNVGSLSEYQNLKDEIVKQLDSTEQVLKHHFDCHNRPDQLWKASELSNLLTFYLNRAERYQLISTDFVKEAKSLLSTLEQGYELRFSRSALVFDFSQEESYFSEQEADVEFHRIGRDLIKELVETPDYYKNLLTGSLGILSSLPLHSIDSAAFLVPERDYSLAGNTLAEELAPTQVHQHKPSNPSLTFHPVSSESASPAYKVERVSDTANSANQADSAQVDSVLSCKFDVMLGVQTPSSQFGILGETGGKKIALDLSEPQTISLFGVQGAGKSYTLGTIIEMACASIDGINNLPSPLATVVFHYSSTEDYKPELTSMVYPNSEDHQLEVLRDQYGATPTSLKDIVILTSTAKLEERQAEYPNIRVLPITFASSELKAPHWKFLMGAVGSQSLYLRKITQIMKSLRSQMTLDKLRQGIENSTLADNLKELARARLSFAAEYIDDKNSLAEIMKPGRLIIVDLRDEFIDRDEALGLFMVMLQLFSDASPNTQSFNKLIVFDEAHKYMQSPELIAGMIEIVREMRHKGTSILIASQDPASVPISLIELSSQLILHRFNSPAWLKHLQKAITVLGSLTPEKMSGLNSGEAFVWSSKSTDISFSQNAIRIRCRPRATLHGGITKKVH